MQIKTSVRFVKVNRDAQHELRKLVNGNHDIAWSEEADSQVELTGNKHKVTLLETPNLRTFSINNSNQDYKTRQIRQKYLTLGKKGCDLAQQCFPDVIDRPVDGIKLLIASAHAYDAWTDKNDSYIVEGSLATGKAFIQAFDVMAPFFPVLQQYQTHKQVAGLLLNVANSVYVVQKDYNPQPAL
jgi:hypothetical protein